MYKFIIIKKRTAIVCLTLVCIMLATTLYISAAELVANSSENEEKINLPILMYHSILKNPDMQGKYVVSPQTFESDIKYLKDNGYTTILSDELIAYVKNGVALPQKPIMITLDDGYFNNLTYVLPLLEKYDMKAVISVVGKYTERFSAEKDHNPNYSHFSWDDIKECVNSGRIEIGNHTYDMHKQEARKGAMKKRSESMDAYEKTLTDDILKAQSLLLEKCNITPKIFTYPYGAVSNASIDIIKNLGFEISLGCCEKVNELTRDENSLYLLCRFNRPSGISTENFMEKLTQ